MWSDQPDSSQPQLQPHTGHDGETEGEVQDIVLADLPTSSKFGFARPADPFYNQRLKSPERPLRRLSSSAAAAVLPTEETLAAIAGSPMDRSHATSAVRTETSPSPPTRQRLSRAFSMPFPSQLGHLQNPCRTSSSTPLHPTSPEADEDISHFRELSLELADSVQMVVQTLLQISPPQVLDPAKEQFSACSVSFPTSAMSAMFTSMKSLNYMSANMSAFCTAALTAQKFGKTLNPPFHTPCHDPNDFDIGELLQSVGDALSGAAAEAGVDIILYHGDVALKHVVVRGDESGMTYALSHVGARAYSYRSIVLTVHQIVRQIMRVASRGDAIEIGLFVTPISSEFCGDIIPSDESREEPDKTSLPIESSQRLRCTFDIYHKFVAPEGVCDNQDTPPLTRPSPTINSLLLQRLLSHLGASLTSDCPLKTSSVGRVCELTFKLDRGLESILGLPSDAPSLTSDEHMADEPTLEQLVQFTERLREKKATLYASAKGSFAHHLTSYLTAWGLYVRHASGEADVDEEVESPEITSSGIEPSLAGRPLLSSLVTGVDTPPATGIPSAVPEDLPQHSKPISFILIDDDVAVLRERLRDFHTEQNNLFQVNLRKHTSSAFHWTRTSPQITRSVGQFQPSQPSVVVIHFASLANYKMIKDVVQSDLLSYTGTQFTIPEIMIIPKPAGPRRVLTALYTAVTKPAMDPYFSPIATSPSTPNVHGKSPFFNFHHAPQRSPTNRPIGSRANSDRSARSVAGDYPMPIPSPLALADGIDYFPEGSAKLGTSPSSGLVIQSPDGQPAGIFFLPKSKASWTPPTSLSMERDKGQHAIPSERRRLSVTHPSPRIENKSLGTFSSFVPTSPPSFPPSAIDSRDPQLNHSTPPARAHKEPRHVFEEQAASRSSQFPSSPPASRQLNVPEFASRRAVSDPMSPRREGSIPPSAMRRTIPKRRSGERQPSSLPSPQKHSKGPGDGNIVPPICVLIVDGEG